MVTEKPKPRLYRCACRNILRQKDIAAGICSGHRVQNLYYINPFEWLKIKFWALTGRL